MPQLTPTDRARASPGALPALLRGSASFSLALFSESQLFGSGQAATLKGGGQAAKSTADFKDYSGLKILTLRNCFLIR